MVETKEKKIKKASEQLSERVDALEITLLMLINSLRNVKSFEVDGEKYSVTGQIPETTLKMIEGIIVKGKN